MNIEAHVICWNENETIHLTIRHYQQFCSKITIWDNYSTDNTPEIAKSMGCEVKQFGIKGVLSDQEYTRLKNNIWKGSKADWVIICDADEILEECHRVLVSAEASFSTIIKTYGWNVFSHKVPREIWSEIKTGFHDPNYSKLCVFKPKDIKEINYVHGCHVAKPEGYVKYHSEVLILYHYRNVGGPERLVARHALYRPRMSNHNLKWNMGGHYLIDDETRRKEWQIQYEKSIEYSPDFILRLPAETSF